jgi:LPS export ABC transporter protein LptC/lipopolysaccharide transport protein LptA
MNSQLFSTIALVAALLLGYAVLVGRNDDSTQLGSAPVVLGYYLKDAIVTETAKDGTPHLRFAAAEATQNPADNSVALSTVRLDYFDASRGAMHWVLNADRAQVLAHELGQAPRLKLQDNVVARTDSNAHALTLNTASLDLDTEQRIAQTKDVVHIEADDHRAAGRGLLANLQTGKVQLLAAVELIAQLPPKTTKPGSNLSLPNAFVADSFVFDANTNVWILTKVRSKVPPLIEADQARTTGGSATNNQIVLTGNVRIELPGKGQLRAAAATAQLRDGRIASARTTGSPVMFEHQDANSKRSAKGHANTIDYDVQAQLLRIEGNARFIIGQYEAAAEAVEYNLATGQVRSLDARNELIIKDGQLPLPSAPK